MYIKRKLTISGYHVLQKFCCSGSNDLIDLLQTSIIVSIAITKKIGMLHIKRKLKTEVLQRKYGQVNLRSKERPQSDLH